MPSRVSLHSETDVTEALSRLSPIAVQVFAVSSMLAVGLRYSVGEILEPLRNIRGTVAVLIANFVAIPLLAFAISRLIRLEAAYADGLMIVACAAGAATIVKLLMLARNDVAFGSGILVLLLAMTIIYLPLVLPRLLPAGEVSAGAVARPLALTMLAPLAAGMIARPWAKGVAPRVLPWLQRTANVSLILVVTLSLGLHIKTVGRVFGSGAILAALVFILGAYGVGWLVGAFGHSAREGLGLMTAQRNFTAALVVAADSFSDRRVLVMVVLMSILSLAVLIPGSKWIGRRHAVAKTTYPSRTANDGQRSAA